MNFSDSELGDIRIALQDRAGVLASRQNQYNDRTGRDDEAITIEIGRISGIIAKLDKR